MGKYIEDAKELLTLVGGRTNISAVTHCMTRMRFVLADPAKAEVDNIEKMSIVKGTFTQAGQFQVIIGNEVSDFYDDFIAVSGIEGVDKAAVKKAAKANQNVLQRLVGTLAEIFTPLLPAIICGGLILGFRNVIDSIYMFDNGTKTLVQISQFWNGVDSFLWLIGEAVFHIGIPLGICWSVMKKMGGTEILGIVLGITLTSSQLLNAYAVASTPASKIPVWNFGFIKVNMIGYQAQVIPAMLAAFTLVYLERFFKKITPKVVSMIVVPFCSLLLAVMMAHFVLGPIGWKIGSAISAVIYAGITGPVKVLFGAVFGTFYAPLVITGLHHMSNAIDLQLVADFKGTGLWPMIALSNIAQGSAVVGMAILQKKNAKAQEVNMPSAISCYLGVTEPAMFGVNLKYRFPFVCGMIGSGLAGMLCTLTNTTANGIGVGGLPGILSIKPQYWGSFALCMAVAIVVPIVLVLILGKKRLTESEKGLVADIDDVKKEEEFTVSSKQVDVCGCVEGNVIPLKDVHDKVFSEGLMGEGVAIVPDGEEIKAPCDAKVQVMMEETGHAVGLKLENGAELLIHIGLDTVYMNGEGFENLVRVGDVVKKGTPLIKFSKDKIKAANHEDTVMCIITDKGLAKDTELHTGMKADLNTPIITMEVGESMTDFKNKVIYQIYPKSFKDTNHDGIGDLKGITQSLDYLNDLGVDYLWLTPFVVSPQRDNGYDIADYYHINPMYGTDEDLDELINQANKRDIGLMMDMVFNHTSTDHEWFQKALQGDPYYQDFYIFKDSKDIPNNWVSKFGGPAWNYAPELKKWYLCLFDKTQADLNWDNPHVREELKNVIRFWKERGIKGFRFDVINLISKGSYDNDYEGDGRRYYTDGPHVHEYIHELVHDTGIKDMITVGEMSSTSLEDCIKYSNSEREELKMTFSFHHLKVDYKDNKKWELMDPDYKKLKELFKNWQLGMQAGHGWNALFWCNHDQPRIVSRFGDEGKYWKESAKMLATMIHMMQGTPYIYQGEELGMLNSHYEDISEYRDVESLNYYKILLEEGHTREEALHILSARSRDNSRSAMQWDDSTYAGFSDHEPWITMPHTDKHINVKEEINDKDSILNYYKQLVELRHELPVISEGTISFLYDDREDIMSYQRQYEDDELVVICNMWNQDTTVTLEDCYLSYTTLLSNYPITVEKTLKLPPYATIVLRK